MSMGMMAVYLGYYSKLGTLGYSSWPVCGSLIVKASGDKPIQPFLVTAAAVLLLLRCSPAEGGEDRWQVTRDGRQECNVEAEPRGRCQEYLEENKNSGKGE